MPGPKVFQFHSPCCWAGAGALIHWCWEGTVVNPFWTGNGWCLWKHYIRPAHTLMTVSSKRGLVKKLGDGRCLAREREPRAQLCDPLPNSTLLAVTSCGSLEIKLWWEYLHHRNWQMPQRKASLPTTVELLSNECQHIHWQEFCAGVQKNTTDLRPALKRRWQGASQ